MRDRDVQTYGKIHRERKGRAEAERERERERERIGKFFILRGCLISTSASLHLALREGGGGEGGGGGDRVGRVKDLGGKRMGEGRRGGGGGGGGR